MDRQNKNWLDAFMEYCAHTESPPHTHFWTGISTIAGALGRRVCIDQGTFRWYPNQYIVLVGPPDIISKSTTMKAGMDLLAQVPAGDRGSLLGPTSATWQALIKHLKSVEEDISIDGKTIETIAYCTCSASELGNFIKTDDKDALDMLIELWDGGRIDKMLIKEGGSYVVEHPLLNLNGCTTPSWIQQSIPAHMLRGGLMSRIIFVHADKKAKLVAYPGDNLPAGHAALKASLISDLIQISEMKGIYRLEPEAKALGKEWYEAMYSQAAMDDPEVREDHRMTRKQTHVHKLVQCIAAAKRNSLIITREDMEQAIACIEELQDFRSTVMQSVGMTADSEVAISIINAVTRLKSIDIRALHRLVHKEVPSLNAFVELLRGAANAGYIKMTGEATDRWMIESLRPYISHNRRASDK